MIETELAYLYLGEGVKREKYTCVLGVMGFYLGGYTKCFKSLSRVGEIAQQCESPSCSSKGPKLCSQHLHESSQPSVISVPG